MPFCREKCTEIFCALYGHRVTVTSLKMLPIEIYLSVQVLQWRKLCWNLPLIMENGNWSKQDFKNTWWHIVFITLITLPFHSAALVATSYIPAYKYCRNKSSLRYRLIDAHKMQKQRQQLYYSKHR